MTMDPKALKKWADPKKSEKKDNTHIVVHLDTKGGVLVREHGTKKDAHADAKKVRGAGTGETAFVHKLSDAKKFGLDPRVPGSQMHGKLRQPN